MKVEWGVSYQRNDGPLDATGHLFVKDEWSRTIVVGDWPTLRDARQYAQGLQCDGRLYRRVRLVRREVTKWTLA